MLSDNVLRFGVGGIGVCLYIPKDLLKNHKDVRLRTEVDTKWPLKEAKDSPR